MSRMKELPGISTLQQLGIPESCSCIVHERIADSISAFIALCQHKSAISVTLAKDLGSRLSLVEGNSYAPARYLGRMELIDEVARALNAKLPKTQNLISGGKSDWAMISENLEDSQDEDLEEEDCISERSKPNLEDDFDWEW